MTAKSNKYGLIVVSAPSGAGKSTLCTRMLSSLSTRLELSISSTSRAPRGREQNGKEYYFLSRDEFTKRIDDGEFAEWALVHGNYYGTLKKTIEDFWKHHHHVLLDIDVQGAASLRRAYPERTFSVFIAPPSLEELERRLRGRGTETEEAIQKRMQNARDEMKRMNEFDLVLTNDVLDNAYQKLEAAVQEFMDQLEGGTWQKHH